MRILSAIVACLLCICTLLPLCAQAETLSGKNRLSLHYYAVNEALPLADATFYLYRVAEPDEKGKYTLTEKFDDCRVDVSDLDWNEAGRMTMLAITLSAYAERDNIAPLKKAQTDSKGNLTFKDLEDGLYLVWGDVLTVDVGDQTWNFTPQPLLLPLPYLNIDGSIVRDMEVDVKYDRFPPPTMGELVDLTVRKVWEGTDDHPDSVTAQLMRNGIVTDTAVLNASNNWQYVWKNLNSGYLWQIMEEKVPYSYTMTIHQEEYLFTIINTEQGVEDSDDRPTEPSTNEPPESETPPTNPNTDAPPEGETPPNTDKPPEKESPPRGSALVPPVMDTTPNQRPNTPPAVADPTEHSTENPPDRDTPPDEPGGPGKGSGTGSGTGSGDSRGDSKLPQTGQLWWPVPLLAGSGLLLIGVGLLRRKDED